MYSEGLTLTVGAGFCASYLMMNRLRKQKQTQQPNSSHALQLTKRVANSKPILIKEIARDVAAAIGAGHDIINLSQGVPCLPIFEEAAAAMQKLLDTRMLPYSDVPGHTSVRETAARFVNAIYFDEREEKGTFDAENVIVTAGGIQACFNTLALVLESEQDVVLSTLPAYSLYQSQATYFGASFHTIETRREEGFKISCEALQQAFKSQARKHRQVRAVVVCAPNNPTGACMTPAEARSIAELLEAELVKAYAVGRRGFLVLLDEVYLGIETEKHVSLLQAATAGTETQLPLPLLQQHLCLVLSCSKGLGAMPGLRAAWVTSPNKALIREMVKVQSNASANASTLSQAGLQATLSHLLSQPSALQDVNDYYQARTSIVVRGLNALGEKHGLGKLCLQPQGTFYVWADFGALRERSLQIAATKTEGEGEGEGEGGGSDPYVPMTADLQLQRLLLGMHRRGDPGGEARCCGLAVIPGAAFSMRASLMMLRFNCAKHDVGELHAAMGVVDRAIALVLHEGAGNGSGDAAGTAASAARLSL